MVADATVDRPQVGKLSIHDLLRHERQWRDLAQRALEPNPFAESAFLAAAIKHIAPRRLLALCVWDGPDRTRLDALAVLQLPRGPVGIIDVWRCEQAPLPALLVDGGRAIACLEAMTDWMAGEWPSAAAFCVPNVDVGGKLAQAIRDIASKRALRLEPSAIRERAALECGNGQNFAAVLKTKRRKDWARLRRRLDDRGSVEFGWSNEPQAIEDFLALEAASWKGARGTALASETSRAAFARDMLQEFASASRLHIARLSVDGRAIAAGIVFRSGERAYYWKTAFDAAFASFSPGVQLTMAMSHDLQADRTIALVDSCADPNHPMIDRLWTGRIESANFMLATGAGASVAAPLALLGRRAKESARELVKAALRRKIRRPV